MHTIELTKVHLNITATLREENKQAWAAVQEMVEKNKAFELYVEGVMDEVAGLKAEVAILRHLSKSKI